VSGSQTAAFDVSGDIYDEDEEVVATIEGILTPASVTGVATSHTEAMAEIVILDPAFYFAVIAALRTPTPTWTQVGESPTPTPSPTTESRDLQAQSYASTTWPFDSGDYSAVPGDDALQGWSLQTQYGESMRIQLDNAGGIDPGGYSGPSLHVGGGKPADCNVMPIAPFESEEHPGLTLRVQYVLAPKPTPPPPGR
jgi:hypothetical protein